jgi:hypothetical protein
LEVVGTGRGRLPETKETYMERVKKWANRWVADVDDIFARWAREPDRAEALEALSKATAQLKANVAEAADLTRAHLAKAYLDLCMWWARRTRSRQ